MKRMQLFLALAITSAVMLSATQNARAGGTPLTTERVAFGMSRPIGVFHAPGDFDRIFITEKRGIIRILENGTLLGTPFLDIDSLVGTSNSVSDERGLLGMAFHPDYATNGFFYLYYINNASDTQVARYSVTANPNVADPASADPILFINQPQTNHNGGWIDFGPNDGYLYIATGDGGGANDQHGAIGNAQNLNNLLGKMLRIDIDGDDFPADPTRDYAIPGGNPFATGGGSAEIWSYGLRNPWRNSFDRETGDLYIGDVGQGSREEVDYQSCASAGGENYGWRCMEGLLCTGLNGGAGCVCNSNDLVLPIRDYSHGLGFSITGGYVYRGCAIPDLQGTYIYADYGSARIWSFRYDGSNLTDFMDRTVEFAPGGGLSIGNIASFGQDAYGEIYICDQAGGEVFKIIPDTAVPAVDCDNNLVEDGCEIADGSGPDAENDGILDACQPVRILQAQGLAGQTNPQTGLVDPAVESTDGKTLDQGASSFNFVFSEEVRDIGGSDLTAAAFSVRETGIGFGIDGSQQPTPNGSDAFGLGNVSLNGDQTALTIHIEHSLAAPTAAHIHRAAAGQSGGVVFGLGDPASPIDTVWGLSPTDVDDLNAGLLYVNIHSAAFPGGEIRGQIIPIGIDSVDTSGNPSVTVNFNRPISLKEWTTVEAAVENLSGEAIENLGDLGPGAVEPDRVDVGFLPTDVDQNGTVTPFDLLTFRQLINFGGDCGGQPPLALLDIDRNGAATPFDLLAYRQLVNGVSPPATMSWNGQAMLNDQP